MKIALIYDKLSESTTASYYERVLSATNLEFSHFWVEGSETIPKDYDLYLRIDHGDYKYDIPKDLHPAVFYVIDTHLKKPYKKIKKQLHHYDLVFAMQKTGAERLQKELKRDIKWMPPSCDPEIHKRLDIEKKYDVGFVGRDAQKYERGKQLALLRETFPNSFIGEADFRKMSEIYSASKIGFNSSVLDDVNMRCFEAPCAGAMLLTNRIKNDGLYEIFEEDKHAVFYDNNEEMIEKIKYYLEHDEERERIAQAGHERVVNHFTYYHSLKNILDHIATELGEKYDAIRI